MRREYGYVDPKPAPEQTRESGEGVLIPTFTLNRDAYVGVFQRQPRIDKTKWLHLTGTHS